MVTNDVLDCPNCGGTLRHYDRVWRLVVTKGGIRKRVQIRRLRCDSCHMLHRELPEYIYPYKHYEAGIIDGVVNGNITADTIGYEDYPCEMTMNRWLQK